jgi:hypothetical protein
MAVSEIINWSSKFKKFGINDPFLQLVTVKYESQIPWQVAVKDEKSFHNYIREVMLPELKAKAVWDNLSGYSSKSLFVHFSKIDVEQTIAYEALTSSEKQEANQLLSRVNEYEKRCLNGEITDSFDDFKSFCRIEAAQYLASVFNKRKELAFSSWFELMTKKFKTNYAFQYLILKPLIEQSGYNSRRAISAPDNSVLKWLYVRIKNRLYSPSVNFINEYRFRLINGLNGNLTNGWQYIPSGVSNTSMLTAACSGSGWCTAGSYMANYYLAHCFFYILRVNRSHVVAIRVNQRNNKILEIRGVYNNIASDYYPEIWFFIKTIFKEINSMKELEEDLVLKKMLPDFSNAINKRIDEKRLNIEWWQEKLDLWPATMEFIPDEIKSKCSVNSELFVSNSFYLSLGQDFRNKYGVKFIEAEIVNLIIQYPQLYNTLGINSDEKYRSACIKGTLNRLKLEDITMKEFGLLPDFVRNSPEVNDSLVNKFPSSFEKGIIKKGASFKERSKGILINELVSYSNDEAQELTILRTLEFIIKNQSSDFSDTIFPEEIRSNVNFNNIRKQAWLRAVLKNPTFYFAFPVDLITEKIWSPETTIDSKHTDMLNKWIKEIELRPWYLEIDGRVPKSVRNHQLILSAYVKGWGNILKKTPFQIWKKINPYQRVYMSYAALRNFHIFKTIAFSLSKTGSDYNKSSRRMREIPAYQLAILYSSVINNIPERKLKDVIIPLFPASIKGVKSDPQRILIGIYLSGGPIQFSAFLNKKDTPENFYFNHIEPDVS